MENENDEEDGQTDKQVTNNKTMLNVVKIQNAVERKILGKSIGCTGW